MDSGTQQAIAASIAASIAALISTCVTAYFGYRASKLSKVDLENRRQLEKQTQELLRCYRQLASYHKLESLACEQIAKQSGINAATTQKALRALVVDAGLERPKITQNDASTRIAELNT